MGEAGLAILFDGVVLAVLAAWAAEVRSHGDRDTAREPEVRLARPSAMGRWVMARDVQSARRTSCAGSVASDAPDLGAPRWVTATASSAPSRRGHSPGLTAGNRPRRLPGAPGGTTGGYLVPVARRALLALLAGAPV